MITAYKVALIFFDHLLVSPVLYLFVPFYGDKIRDPFQRLLKKYYLFCPLSLYKINKK